MHKVLIVDDELNMRLVLAAMLTIQLDKRLKGSLV